MKLKLFSFIAIAVLFTSCDDPEAWTDERKQVLIDKCDSDLYDCDCFVKTTVEGFP